MELHQLFLTKNDCYKANQKHTVRGIMVHSTAANNPYIHRYVGPDDGIIGPNQYGNHWNQPGLAKCVHGFIGKAQDGHVCTYQTLPWDIAGWHSGSGSLGKAKNANNTGYIGFEICEDDTNGADYFNKIYKEAAELCAYLCKQYGLDPYKNIICHSEGAKMGIASNHSDVMHWFPKHGKSMDTFRAYVKELMGSASEPSEPAEEGEMYRVRKTWTDSKSQKGAFRVLDNAKKCADENPGYSVFNEAGVAIYPKVETPAEPETQLYRVRKTWADASSQKGAFNVLQNAKNCADDNPGYYVFDESGKAIYPTSAPAPEPEPTPAPTGNPYKEPTSNVKKGSKGDGVRWVQWQLNNVVKYDCGNVDGDFGSGTDAAVRELQGDRGISVDGIVGKDTRAQLKVYKAKPDTNFKKGDKVKVKSGVTKYYDGSNMPSWVRSSQLYVFGFRGSNVVITTDKSLKAATGVVKPTDIYKN